MPGSKFSKKVDTPKKERQWEHVYESVLSRGGDKGSAIRQASGVIKKESSPSSTREEKPEPIRKLRGRRRGSMRA